MNWDAYIDHIRADSALVADAARRGLEPDVPCCEGWTVRDLVGHLGQVHRHKALIVEQRLKEAPDEETIIPEADLVEWFEEGSAMLLAALAGADPAEPAWTWHEPDQTIGFWYRRMAHETLIHRIDAEQSFGVVSGVDEELAADGVGEIIARFLTGLPDWTSFERSGPTVCVSIPGRSWSLDEGRYSGTSPASGDTYEDLLAFELGSPRADIATSISGEPVAMNLWLWGRGPIEDLSVDGDAGLVATLRQAAREATQ